MDKEPTESSGLKSLLSHLLENWENPAAHDTFLEACDAAHQLPFAAREYRKISLMPDPERAERAEEQLQKITARALSQLEASRATPRDTKRIMTWIAIVVASALVLTCAWLIL